MLEEPHHHLAEAAALEVVGLHRQRQQRGVERLAQRGDHLRALRKDLAQDEARLAVAPLHLTVGCG